MTPFENTRRLDWVTPFGDPTPFDAVWDHAPFDIRRVVWGGHAVSRRLGSPRRLTLVTPFEKAKPFDTVWGRHAV